jgi:hypothetical protein
MAFETKEAAFVWHDYYGKSGIFAILQKNKVILQRNFVNYQNQTALTLSLKKG